MEATLPYVKGTPTMTQVNQVLYTGTSTVHLIPTAIRRLGAVTRNPYPGHLVNIVHGIDDGSGSVAVWSYGRRNWIARTVQVELNHAELVYCAQHGSLSTCGPICAFRYRAS